MSESVRDEGTEPSDASLLRDAKAGDATAYSRLWHRHSGAATSSVRALARGDVDDVVAEAFTAIWEQLQRGVGPDSQFRPYLVTVAKNIAASNHRHRQRVFTNFEFSEEGLPSAAASADSRFESESIIEAFQRLPEQWRRILWLSTVEGLPRAEVSEALGLTPNTVSVTVRRAKEGLRLAWLRTHIPAAGLSCGTEFPSLLPEYVRESTPASRIAAVRTHLATCSSCAQTYDVLKIENQKLESRTISTRLRGTAAAVLALASAGGILRASDEGDTTEQARASLVPKSEGPLAANPRRRVLAGVTAVLALGILVSSPFAYEWLSLGTNDGSLPETQVEVKTDHGGKETQKEGKDTDGSAGHGSGEDAQSHIIRSGDATSLDAGETKPGQRPSRTPQGQPLALSVRSEATNVDTLPPHLTGTAQPGTLVKIVTNSDAHSVQVGDGGEWAFDLAAFPFSPGVHSVTVRSGTGASTVSRRLSFTVEVPEVARINEASAIQPDAFHIRATGQPGAEICWNTPTGNSNRLTLDTQGHARTASMTGWNDQYVNVSYCERERYGPSARMWTISGIR